MSILNKLDFITRNGKNVPDKVYHTVIDKILDSNNIMERMMAARHGRASEDNLHKALDDDHYLVRRNAIDYGELNQSHLTKALKDKDAVIKSSAKQIIRML